MNTLPPNVRTYKKTPIFDQDSVPKGILMDHQTKPGVWGKINIIEGRLLYIIQSEPIEEVELDTEIFGVVEPEVLHHVKPMGKVKFFVEFLK